MNEADRLLTNPILALLALIALLILMLAPTFPAYSLEELEEILANGAKYQEALQDVPVSIAVISVEAITAKGITLLDDLSIFIHL